MMKLQNNYAANQPHTLILVIAILLGACSTTSRNAGVIDDGLTAPAEEVDTEIVEQQPKYVFDDEDDARNQNRGQSSVGDEQFKQTRPPSGTVVALLNQARQQKQSGNLERAAAVLERALRLDPKNARLWHELAQLRLEQGKFDLAESLATKSNALARGDDYLIEDNNSLIEQVKLLSGG